MNTGNTYTKISNHLMYGFTGLSLIIAILTNLSLSYSATAIVDPFSIYVQTYCTFATNDNNYTRTVSGGGSSITIQGNNITSSCNDDNGYAIYAIGYSGNTYTSNYHTDMISDQDNSYNIKTDGSGTYGSSWQMRLTANNNAEIDNNFNNYQNIPGSFTKVAHYNSNTNNSVIAPTYQINISTTQPDGVYAGSVKYILVHPNNYTPGTYTISYHANGGSGVMADNTELYNFESQTLNTNTFTAPNDYYFANWCTTQDNNQSPQTTCTDIAYADGAVISPNTIAANGTLNLYAVWTSSPPSNQTNANPTLAQATPVETTNPSVSSRSVNSPTNLTQNTTDTPTSQNNNRDNPQSGSIANSTDDPNTESSLDTGLMIATTAAVATATSATLLAAVYHGKNNNGS